MFDDIVVNASYKFHPHSLQMTEVCNLAQNDNYCTESDILGPIFGEGPYGKSNNIYFFANYGNFFFT